jgi:hypothetical protein
LNREYLISTFEGIVQGDIQQNENQEYSAFAKVRYAAAMLGILCIRKSGIIFIFLKLK